MNNRAPYLLEIYNIGTTR